jgi:hypothetical protein
VYHYPVAWLLSLLPNLELVGPHTDAWILPQSYGAFEKITTVEFQGEDLVAWGTLRWRLEALPKGALGPKCPATTLTLSDCMDTAHWGRLLRGWTSLRHLRLIGALMLPEHASQLLGDPALRLEGFHYAPRSNDPRIMARIVAILA